MEGFLAVIAVVGTLSGVGIGWWLDRKTRREERVANDRTELLNTAASVLGETKLTLEASNPLPFAAFASKEKREEVELRRIEADRVRPQLSVLAIRWPEAESELSEMSDFLGQLPNRLNLLITQVLKKRDARKLTSDLRADHQSAIDALERAVTKLHEPGKEPED